MDAYTKDLVSNASAQLIPDNTLSSLTNVLPEILNLEGQWEVVISEVSCPSMYQNVTEGKLMFLEKKLPSRQKFTIWSPFFNRSIADIVDAMNTLFQERHNHNENCITLKVT